MKNSKNSREKILEKLLQEDLNAVQLANRIEIGESTIREHLQKLKEKGFVDTYYDKSKKGRPKKKYSITLEGRESFPRTYRFILSHLLKRLELDIGGEELHKIMEKVANDITDIDKKLFNEDVESRLEKYIGFREQIGLKSSLSIEDGLFVLELNNCGCVKADKGIHKYLCRLCKQSIKNYAPTCNVEQTECIMEGDNSCTFKIEKNLQTK